MEIQNLKTNTRTISVEFGGQSFDVTYHPMEATRKSLAAFGAEIDRVAESGADADLYVVRFEFLACLIADWELTAGGEKLPVSVASMEMVPLPVLNAIQNAIFRDAGEDPKPRKRTSMTG